MQTTINAAKVYKTKGVLAGYLGYADITTKMKALIASIDPDSGEKATVQIKQYWTTLDGIEVQGTMKRTLTFSDGTINGLTKLDTKNN